MVVWQGITEGGTAVPVQITEEGKVVAIGEAGPAGPPGPPGQAEWPPNPIEGAFLVWLNGEPTWYAESPIPTPPGFIGPIIQVDQNSLLIFEDDVDQNIFFNGVQVYAVNADGSNWTGGNYNTSQMWSSNTSDTWSYSLAAAFNGDTSGRGAFAPAGQSATVDFTDIFATSIQVGGVGGSTDNSWVITTSDGTFNPTWKTGAYRDYYVPITAGNAKLISIENTDGTGELRGVWVNTVMLLDPLSGPYPRGQISTVANNSALLSRVYGKWTEGLYMKADESAQAAWLISKKRKGKI